MKWVAEWGWEVERVDGQKKVATERAKKWALGADALAVNGTTVRL
jgi:hypothetical protein